MASMMGGDFVEAYVLKTAYKEKLRRMAAAEEEKSKQQGPREKSKASGGSRGGGGALFGLLKKKVHPKAAVETSSPNSLQPLPHEAPNR